MKTEEFDVVIVGAGPAGSTTGALLAEAGHNVLILERDQFPRYKVGESLLPFCHPSLERLGLVKKMIGSPFIKKYSVQFVTMSGKVSTPFYFFKHIKKSLARTWQVERSEFDQLLADNARDQGAVVRYKTRARSLIRDQRGRVCGVVARQEQGQDYEIRARLVVDASGRDTFAIAQNNWRMPDPKLKKLAIWSYFKGGKRDEGLDEGATTVAYVPDKGWFWYIPLQNDLVSVGVVAGRKYLFDEGSDLETIFQREVKKNKWIEDHLAAADCVRDYKLTGDYSYRSKHVAEDGLLLVGDAFAFLDPVFSSGVFLALKSGVLAADAISAGLQLKSPDQAPLAASLFESYGAEFRHGLEAMRRLVYAFYDQNFSFGAMLKKYPELREDVTDCLIGQVDRDFDALWQGMAEFAELPSALAYGRPLASGSEQPAASKTMPQSCVAGNDGPS